MCVCVYMYIGSVCNPEHALLVNSVMALCQESNPGKK